MRWTLPTTTVCMSGRTHFSFVRAEEGVGEGVNGGYLNEKYLYLLFNYSSQIVREKFRSPYLGKAQQSQEQRYNPYIPNSVCGIFECRANSGCQSVGFLTCTQMLMHAIAHGGCTNTVREPAVKVDWEKNPLPHRGIEPWSVLLAPGLSVRRCASCAIPPQTRRCSDRKR